MTLPWGSIKNGEAIEKLKEELSPLLGTEIEYLKIPKDAAVNFEPSQVGTIVGTLTDASLSKVAFKQGVGLRKANGILGDREGYPDFQHSSGYRLELKGVFSDNNEIELKKPPTPRESSARLTQKVTVKNVNEDTDGLLLLAYQLKPSKIDSDLLTPVITDLEIIPVIDCIHARDYRLVSKGGRWFGDYETPAVISKIGKEKVRKGEDLNTEIYGRKESEGYDFNEDTNFGKLKRIPLKPLQDFLKKQGCSYTRSGGYPEDWKIE